MKILDKYLFLSTLGASFKAIFFLSLLLGLFKFIEEMANLEEYKNGILDLFEYLFFLMPSFINSVLLLGILLGIVISVGALNSNRELLLYEVGSISKKQIIIKILKISLFISVFSIFLLELTAPSFFKHAKSLRHDSVDNIMQTNDSLWFKTNKQFIFLKSQNKLNENFALKIFNIDKDEGLTYFLKSSDVKIDEGKINIQNYERSNINYSGKLIQIDKKKVLTDLDIPDNFLSENQIKVFKTDLKEKNLLDVFEILIYSLKADINSSAYIVEILNRVIRPITLIGMILISTPLIINFSRTLSLSRRIYFALGLGIAMHLFSKISFVISMKFDSLVYIAPLLPSFIIVFVGYLMIKYKMMV